MYFQWKHYCERKSFIFVCLHDRATPMPVFYHQSFGSVKINLFCVEVFCQKASYHVCYPELLPELSAQGSVGQWALGRGVRRLQTGLPEISTSPLLRDHCLCFNRRSAAQASYSLHWLQPPSLLQLHFCMVSPPQWFLINKPREKKTNSKP